MKNINKKKRQFLPEGKDDMTTLMKKAILRITLGGFLVFKFFIPNLKRRGDKCLNTYNPFYKDNNPSFHVYKNEKTNKWHFIDYGNPTYKGDCFDFVAFKYNCDVVRDFFFILFLIERDLKIDAFSNIEEQVDKKKKELNYDYNYTSSKNSIKGKEERPFTLYEKEKLSSYDKKWLKQFKINKGLLSELNTVFINGFKAVNGDGREYEVETSKEQVMLAFKGDGFAKIYGSNPKFFRYIGNKPSNYIFGFCYNILRHTEELGLDKNICFITGGEKDVLTFYSLGYPAVCYNSETAYISKEQIEELRSYFKYLIICFDIDKTGLDASEAICDEHLLKRLILPMKLIDGKDISDYIKLDYSVEKLNEQINQIVAEYDKESPEEIEDLRKYKKLSLRNASIEEVNINPKKHKSSDNKNELSEEKKAVEETDKKEVIESISDEFHKSSVSSIELKEKINTESLNPDSIPLSVYENLPQLLKDGCIWFDKKTDKDVFLISALTVLSSCLPNLFGFYDGIRTSPHLYTFLMAPASAGKGSAVWAKKLTNPLLQYFKERYQEADKKYKQDLKEHLNKKEKEGLEEPVEPRKYIHFIPANASTSAIIKTITDNGGTGIIFETEADSLVEALKQQHGNFSHILRSAYHHESISLVRKTNDEHIEFENPQLSVLLTGTPEQFYRLVPDPENGLFSRINLYSFDLELYWKRVFDEKNNQGKEKGFEELGIQLCNLYKKFEAMKEVEFKFSHYQQEITYDIFLKWKIEFFEKLGIESVSSINRIGIIEFRIAMILTALRVLETENIPMDLVCSNTDFETAIQIAEVFKKHAYKLLTEMSKKNKLAGFEGIQLEYLKALPSEFDRKLSMKIADTLNIKEKTAERYLEKFQEKGLLSKPRHNLYHKAEL